MKLDPHKEEAYKGSMSAIFLKMELQNMVVLVDTLGKLNNERREHEPN